MAEIKKMSITAKKADRRRAKGRKRVAETEKNEYWAAEGEEENG